MSYQPECSAQWEISGNLTAYREFHEVKVREAVEKAVAKVRAEIAARLQLEATGWHEYGYEKVSASFRREAEFARTGK